MSKIVIYTQIRENYGTVDQPHWKFKGGDEYLILDCGIHEDDEFAFKKARMVVDGVRGKVEQWGPMYEEWIINHVVVPDDQLTEFEKDQLEFDGSIRFPIKVLELDDASCN